MNSQAISQNGQLVSVGPFADLLESLASVQALFVTTLGALDDSAKEMRGRGLPPGYGLVFEISECHRAFSRLRAEGLRRVESLGLVVPSPGLLADLQELSDLISHYQSENADHVVETPEILDHVPAPTHLETVPAEISGNGHVESQDTKPESPFEATISSTTFDAPQVFTDVVVPPFEELKIGEQPTPLVVVPELDGAEQTRLAALSLLDQVCALRLADSGEFAPLTTCQDQARSLREAIAYASQDQLPVDAGQLVAGEHPFSSLLVVVSGVGDLGDDQWANHHAQISETFGRPLAIAAARGRLTSGR